MVRKVEKKVDIEDNKIKLVKEQIDKGNACPVCASTNMDKDGYPTIFCMDCGAVWDLEENETLSRNTQD